MRRLLFLLFAGMLVWGIGCQKDSLLDNQINLDKVLLQNATEEEIETAIDDGVAWILNNQYDAATGIFGGNDHPERVARTALAVAKLCDYSLENGESIYDGEYSDEIMNALNFIFSEASGDPTGYIFNAGVWNHDVYNTGIAAMAIAAYRCPTCTVDVPGSVVNGLTHLQVMEGIVGYFDAVQYPPNGPNPGGGWRYSDPEPGDVADNSNSGFAVLGLLAAQELGVVIPDQLKLDLSPWLDYIQNDVDGDPQDGGSGYTEPWDWVNILKAGNLLFEFSFVGDDLSDQRVLDALDYIQRHWNDPNTDPGWRDDNYMAMYCLMKGFVNMDIETILVGGSPVDWFAEISEALLDQQEADGSWNPSLWTYDPYTSTVFNLLTLEKITPLAILEVGFDIKPGSCPNPVNRGSKGVVPMAVLGDENFDVHDIDPATVNIGGISPIKWHFEDVSTPYMGDLEDQNDCNTDGPDGYTDFVFHVDAQELAILLAGYEKGDVVVLEVEGQLTDGPAFHGADIIWIVK